MFDIIEENTGYLPVDDKINAIQVLATDKLVMTESGFFEIFCNNDAQTPVYYDNMMITMSSGSVMEVNAYYPYGHTITGLSTENHYAPNFYKFSAVEIQKELELNWYLYEWRPYDPISGRTPTPDKMAEWRYHLSPYSYASNNPINRIDPTGMIDWDWLKNIKDKIVEFFKPEPAINEDNPEQLSEVVISGTRGTGSARKSSIDWVTWPQRSTGSYNTRKSTPFEDWMIRHFDQNEVARMGNIFGDPKTSGGNRNTVNTDASYQGRRPDGSPQTANDVMNKTNADAKASTGENSGTSGQPVSDVTYEYQETYNINHSADTVSADTGGRYAPKDTMGVWRSRRNSSQGQWIYQGYDSYPSRK